MIAITAHYDGKYIVPDGPVDVPRNKPLKLQIDVVQEQNTANEARQVSDFLREFTALAQSQPPDPQLPPDGAAQHDHYLYGTPRR